MGLNVNQYVDIKKQGLFKSEIIEGKIIDIREDNYSDWMNFEYRNKIYTILLDDGKLIEITEPETFNRYKIIS